MHDSSPSDSLTGRLARGEVCVGPFLKLTDPAVIEMVGLAGYSHAVIDLEHGPITIQGARAMDKAVHLAAEHEVIVGTFVDDPTTARAWINCGVRYICMSVDVGIFMDALRRLRKNIFTGEK